MNTVAIIQARTGSTRLPNKVLTDICGKPMLKHVINRVKLAQKINQVVIATSNLDEDIPIISFAEVNQIPAFAGDPDDVLDRYIKTADEFKADHIVRITADCPFIDPTIIDSVVKTHLQKNADYTSNTLKRTFPRGLDTEVFSYQVLKEASVTTKKSYEREHVTPYIYEHPKKFKLENVVAPPDLRYPEMRLCVDTSEDLEFVKKICQSLQNKNGTLLSAKTIVDYLNQHPEIKKINAKIEQKPLKM